MTIKEKQTMSRLYNEERYSFSKIGRMYNISRQRAHQLIKGYKSFASHNFSSKNIDFMVSGNCKMCSKEMSVDIHHIDGDSSNNIPSNLMRLCKECHYKIHIGKKREYHPKKKAIRVAYICNYCGDVFSRPRGVKNPNIYCSKKCYGQDITISK